MKEMEKEWLPELKKKNFIVFLKVLKEVFMSYLIKRISL